MLLVAIYLLDILARAVEQRIIVLVAIVWLGPVVGVNIGRVVEVALDLAQHRLGLPLERLDGLGERLALGLKSGDGALLFGVAIYLSPAPFVTASITRSRLKLPGFWRGGNSRKLCSQLATKPAAGAIANMRSEYQS